MPNKIKTIYIFEGAAYDEYTLNDHLEELVVDRYLEIVHSDFMPGESSEYESLWDEAEELELTFWESKDYFKSEVKEVVEKFEAIKNSRELEVEDYHEFVNAIKKIHSRRN